MAKKKITSLDSLMIFTGLNADKNAQALADRQYNVYNDEYIGDLKMTNTYDSIFSNTSSEVFVETTPKYKSINDIVEIAYAYINNKSLIKPTEGSDMYIDSDGTINFKYDFNYVLKGDVDNNKEIPYQDVDLFLASLNNSMYNKLKYYSKSKEVYELSYKGVTYSWFPIDATLSIYDQENKTDDTFCPSSIYASYYLDKISIETTDETGYTTSVSKNVLSYFDSYYKLVKTKIEEITDSFKQDHDPELLSYYITDLNSSIPFILHTYSFGQQTIQANLNYDGEFSDWFRNRISFNVEDLTDTKLVDIVPTEEYYFNLVKDENDRFITQDIYTSSSYSFSLTDLKDNKFNNLSLLSPYKLRKIDFSHISGNLVGTLDLLSNYDKKINYKDTVETNWLKEKGSQLEELIIGKEGVECKLESINGLEEFTNLKKLDLTNCNNLSSNPDLSNLVNITDYILSGTNVSVFSPAKGSIVKSAILPDCIQSIILNDITFKNNLNYTPNDQLTTVELNNVVGLDTYKFVKQWVNALSNSVVTNDEGEEISKLESGWVNYININNIDWESANYEFLLNLAKIELNQLTGTIQAVGNNWNIYRQVYRQLLDAFGEDKINNDKSDLNIKVSLGENAFNVGFEMIEKYTETYESLNEYGETIELTRESERSKGNLIINVEDTITGNSFIDYILENDNLLTLNFDTFSNNNKENIGIIAKLEEDLILPTNSENPEKLSKGDVLLYGSNKIVIVKQDNVNINQNFTRIGKLEDIDKFNSTEFELGYYINLSSLEDTIEDPDEDNVIIIDYKDITDELDEENNIEVVYTKID